MSLKNEYKVGQRIWYKYFCCSSQSPLAGGAPDEFEIIKITDKTLKVKGIGKYDSEWTINSDMVTCRVWKSLSDFYKDQLPYFKAKEKEYRDVANAVERKLTELQNNRGANV